MEELQVIETTSGRQFKPWATKDDVQDPASVTAVASEIANGKQAIAAAINAKGVPTSPTDSFAQLAENIAELQLNPIYIEDGEIYPSTLYGEHIYDLFKVAEFIRNNYGQFKGFILAQFYKGYATIPLSGADAYLCCDDANNVIIGSTTHTWTDADNGMLDRWVAYLYYNDNYGFASVADGLCPRTILVVGTCNSITINYNRLTNLFIPDGLGSLGTFNLTTSNAPAGKWSPLQVIKNYKEHIGGAFYFRSGTVVCVEFSDLETYQGVGDSLFSGYSNSFSSLVSVSFPKLKTILSGKPLFGTTGQSDFPILSTLLLPALESITNAYIATTGNGPMLASLKEVRFDSLKTITESITSPTYYLFYRLEYLKRLYFPVLEKTSFYAGDGLNGICNYCTNLQYVYFGYEENDRSKSVWAKFYSSSIGNLTDIELKAGYLKNFDCHQCTALTEDNILNHILNRLGDNTGYIALTLKLGATNLGKLTSQASQDRLAELQAQGWTIA